MEMVPCPVFWTDGGDSVINIKLVQNAYILNQHEFTMVSIVRTVLGSKGIALKIKGMF